MHISDSSPAASSGEFKFKLKIRRHKHENTIGWYLNADNGVVCSGKAEHELQITTDNYGRKTFVIFCTESGLMRLMYP